MGSIRRSLAYSLADSYLGLVLQLASSLVISRLLTPGEIGVFAVAAVLAALASTFRDFGVAEYLIQAKELSDGKIRAAFAANLVVSWTMGALLFAGSHNVAEFYRHPGVGEVMRLQALNFVLIPFGAVTLAYFRRCLEYRPIFVSGLLANLTSFVVSIAAALGGLGYMSMAWASLSGVLVTVLVASYYRPSGFPKLPSLKGIGEVVRFGKHASGIYLFGQIGRHAPEAVIGRALDLASVAFFSRANGLMEIFNRTVLRAVTPVCLPYFAHSIRQGLDARQGYLKAVALLTGVGWPCFAVIAAYADQMIEILYGSQWANSVPLATILCLVAALEVPYYLASEVMIAYGRIDQSHRLQVLVQGVRVASLAMVIPFGLTGACWGLAAGAIVGMVIGQRFLGSTIHLSPLDVAKVSLPGAAAAASCAIASLLVQSTDFGLLSHPAVNLSVGASLSVITGLAVLRALHHPIWPEVLALLAKLRR